MAYIISGLGCRPGSTLFVHGVCMLRDCTYGECAHAQHVSRTLTVILTLTHTITAYSVSGNVVRVHILIGATRQKPCRKRVCRRPGPEALPHSLNLSWYTNIFVVFAFSMWCMHVGKFCLQKCDKFLVLLRLRSWVRVWDVDRIWPIRAKFQTGTVFTGVILNRSALRANTGDKKTKRVKTSK